MWNKFRRIIGAFFPINGYLMYVLFTLCSKFFGTKKLSLQVIVFFLFQDRESEPTTIYVCIVEKYVYIVRLVN